MYIIKSKLLSVNFSVVSGGSALVAASLVTGSSLITPALALLFGKIFKIFQESVGLDLIDPGSNRLY